MSCKLACINDLNVQTQLAAENPEALLAHATSGVGLHPSVWRIAFQTDASLFLRVPKYLRTQEVYDAAVGVDIWNFPRIPEDYKRDDDENAYLRAKAAKDAKAARRDTSPAVVPPVPARDDPAPQATAPETRSTSSTTPDTALGSDTHASAATSTLDGPVLIEDVDSDAKDKDDDGEEEDASDDDDSDDDWRSSEEEGDDSDADVSNESKEAHDAHDAHEAHEAHEARSAGKKRERPSAAARKRSPLSHITAVLSKETVKGFEQAEKDISTSASAQDTTKEQEELLSMANRLAKVCMLSESGDTHEANHAKRKLACLLETANREVIDIYLRLTSHSTKPALDGAFEVEILARGQPKAKRALWIVNLATACANANLVATYTRGGRCVGFYGHTTGAIAACRLFIDVIGEVTHTAENESWALGFANRYLAIQRDLKRERDADKNKETALVVTNNKALVQQAAKKLKLRSGRPLQAGPRDRDAYHRGQAAALAYSGKAKQPRLS